MRPMPRPAAIAGYLAAGALVVLGAVSLASSAGAVVAIDEGEPGVLWLEAETLPEWTTTMDPGDAVQWPITTMLESEEDGVLGLEVEHSGGLAATPAGLQLRFAQCDAPWSEDVEPTCAGHETVIVDGPLSSIPSGSMWSLGPIEPGAGPYFLATLWLPEVMSTSLQGESASIAFGFSALGDSASVTVPPGLALTGVDVLPGLWLMTGLVVAGLVLARQRAGGRP